MSRIYIAATLPLLPFVKELADGLRAEGLEVVSSWHEGEPTIEAEGVMSVDRQTEIAAQCFGDIDKADALVLLFGEPTERHGSFVELGYALGRGKPTVAISAGLFPLPTILLLDGRVRCPSLDLASLGSDGVARHVREMLRRVERQAAR